MIFFKRIALFLTGIDIYLFKTWYGFHFYWQSDPLFDVINHHRKNNTIREYGIIIFGLWLYTKIDNQRG
ncbi:hypothetical protein LCGC14_2816580 [marine sediment metagenome]|uniref:Uncharacterized protein n=1 Tax=marine sediment metagenome TaxID=412755 RepID=A0A0F8YI92_9ZZZZ